MRATFKERCLAEWKRLNPRSISSSCSDTPVSAFVRTIYDGAIGYFAPVRFLAWLVLWSWRS